MLFYSCTPSEKANLEVQRLEKLEIENQSLIQKVENYGFEKDIKYELFKSTMRYSFSKINTKNIYFGTDSTKKYTLKNITKEPCLFFYFSNNTCSPCVDAAIELVKKNFPDYITNNRIIIAGDLPKRLRNDCYGKKMISHISVPSNKIDAPFFFILDKNPELIFLHIYDKNDPFMTEIYLNEIKQRFFSNTDKKI